MAAAAMACGVSRGLVSVLMAAKTMADARKRKARVASGRKSLWAFDWRALKGETLKRSAIGAIPIGRRRQD
ncbi:MAG: hypothetical protein ABJM32_08780 [Parasphingorhabdus sp.]